jgi:hypothetical protein
MKKLLIAAALLTATSAAQAIEVKNDSNWLPYWDNFQGTGNNYNIVTHADTLGNKQLKYRVTCLNKQNNKSINTLLHLESAGSVFVSIVGEFKTSDFSGKMITPVTKAKATATTGKKTFNIGTYVPNVSWFARTSYIVTLYKKVGTPSIKLKVATMCGVTEQNVRRGQNINMSKLS